MARQHALAQARVAGLLYLIIIVCAGFSQGYVRSTLIVPADPAATATAILGAEGLFRLGFVADLVAFLADAAVAVLLYLLLKPVSHTVSLLAAAFRLIAHPAIGSLNLLNHWAALLLLDAGGPLASFEPAQLQALSLVAVDLHASGYLIAGAFFGVHCALLGYLLYRSVLFPRFLGVLLVAAALGYLTETFTHFIAPTYADLGSAMVVVTASVAEVTLCLYLIIKGVRRTE